MLTFIFLFSFYLPPGQQPATRRSLVLFAPCLSLLRRLMVAKKATEPSAQRGLLVAKRSNPEKNPKRYAEQKRGKEPLTEESRSIAHSFRSIAFLSQVGAHFL